MQPMGNEKTGLPSFPGRPAASPFGTAPPTGTSFSSSGPVARPEAAGYRAPPPVRYNGPSAPSSMPSYPPRPSVPSLTPSYPPRPSVPSLTPSYPPRPSVPSLTPSYPAPDMGAYPRYATPNYPSSAPSVRGPPLPGQPVFAPPVQPPIGPPLGMPPPASLHPQPPQPQIPTVHMGPPPQSLSSAPPRGSVPPMAFESSFPGPKPVIQPTWQGYPSRPASPVTHGTPAAPAVGAPYLGQQGGFTPAPPAAASLGQQLQYPSAGMPMGTMQGLIEEFSSLSVGSVPGSIDPGVDCKALPRPLDGDLEPASHNQIYPLNCHPGYLRLTTTAIPNSQSLLSRWHLPLAAVIHPLAEAPDGEEVPVVNFGSTGIIRCRRCRTYVNPYVTFTDGGRKWRCNICSLLNDVSGDYFSLLDASGRRIDADQRPELSKGSVEFVAPTEYMVRPPMPPLYFFLIDVSLSAIRSGMLEVVARTVKASLDELPGFPRTQIGFITYDSTLHFYNMKSSLTQPQMMVVSDLEDIFVPLPDDLLVNLSESRSVVDAFLDSLPSLFQDNVNIESAFGPALKAAFMVMGQLGGKLMIFQSTLPSIGVGRLKLRGDDVRVYGTDKEHALRIPEDPFYKQMAADFTKYQIAASVYAFSDKYTDIASLGTLAKYTGGQVYYYPSYQGAIHQEKLAHDLARDLTRETAWEAVMRIRCGKGVRFTTYHGHFMLRSTDLLALPAVDCDKAFSMQLALEETLLTTQVVYFQVALLYTSSSGERRIRVHTAAAPVVSELSEMYRYADCGAIVSVLSRLGIEKTLSSKLEDARHAVQLRIVKGLREYRNLYSVQHRLGGRMIFPETLKLLPLYGLAICKSAPLRGGYADVQLDERCSSGYSFMILPIKRLLKALYPSLMRLDEFLIKGPADVDDFWKVSKPLSLTAESLDPRGLYLCDDGFRFVIWFGRSLSPEIVINLLGDDFPDWSKLVLTERANNISRKLMALLKKIRESDPSSYQLCHLVRQGEQPREGLLLLANLVEDQTGGTGGYIDWIQQIHRQVQQAA